MGKKTLTAQGYPRVKVICFDEITLHKGHGKYLLVISASDLGLVLDVLEDRSKERLLAWLTARGKEWCDGVEVACSDMWDAYQEAAAEKLPNARRVIDRFHVMKNLTEAITKARRIIQRDAEDATCTSSSFAKFFKVPFGLIALQFPIIWACCVWTEIFGLR